MAMRRALGLNCRLTAVACRCEAAHQQNLQALAGQTGHASPATHAAASLHSAAGQALRLAAASLAAAPPCSWPGYARRIAAQSAPAGESANADTDLTFTSSAIERLEELASETPDQPLVLRLTVEGGGCSGFTYHFNLDQEHAPDDRVVQHGIATLVCDPVSFEFVRGSTIDYTTDLIRSAFEVVSNPNAEQSCGCGSSFAPKG